MLQAMSGSETVPLARLEWNDPATIMRMLDAGALGLICPLINTAAECAAFVGACRYPPAGYRSYGPIRAGLRWGSDYFAQANAKRAGAGDDRDRAGVGNVDEIAATPGLDGLYVGPFDLSISLGLTKPADFTDPVLLAALDVVLDATARHDLVTGIYTGSPENALMLARRGFRLVTAAQDTALLQTAVAAGTAIPAGLS